jgi:hypothetical protein
LYGGNTPAPIQSFEEDTNAQNARLSQYKGNPYATGVNPITPAYVPPANNQYSDQLAAATSNLGFGGSPAVPATATTAAIPAVAATPAPSQAPVADPRVYEPNPYLGQMANEIGRRADRSLGMGLQGIRSSAVGVGGLGGSRQGVAEGQAISDSNDNLQGNLSNLYSSDYNSSLGRNLQQYGVDTNANLARSGQDLQRYGIASSANLQNNAQNQNFYTANRGQDLQQYGLDTNAALTNQGQMQGFYTANRGLDQQGLQIGANLFNQGNQGMINQGQGIYGIGNTQQQAPFNVFNNANQTISPYAGAGSSNTSSSAQGGGLSGIAGGAFAGAQIGRNLGFGGGSDPYNVGQGSSYNGNYSRM